VIRVIAVTMIAAVSDFLCSWRIGDFLPAQFVSIAVDSMLAVLR
jgi:hypothetical protein